MELLDKEKQLLFLSFFFMQMYLEEHKEKRYKDIKKLIGTLGKLSSNYRDELEPQLEKAYLHLNKITKGEDIECNVLILSLGLASILVEYSNLDKPISDKIFKLGTKIYNNVVESQGDTQAFKNTEVIVSKFTKEYSK